MLLPKKTFVALAGQNAWHICTGVALPRASGKYLPSQLRTQNAGPEPDATVRCGGAGCWFRPNGSAKKFACGGPLRCCCFWVAPKKKTQKTSAEAPRGHPANAPTNAPAATNNQPRPSHRLS